MESIPSNAFYKNNKKVHIKQIFHGYSQCGQVSNYKLISVWTRVSCPVNR